ncbi:hypothetical protein [Thalassolituus oleivorans]|uniref:hypothetical protein n=1 Tax=Thalassolituus oleivorans TaxID=187493 RepID=UPI0023F4134C|nr:hypothetical protein [Thalassolituus oleivorans]
MNNLVSKILGWLAALAAMAAMFYKGKAATEKAKRAEAEAERERVSAATYQRINTQRAELEQKHQQEQLNDETSIDGRDHFNNRFK